MQLGVRFHRLQMPPARLGCAEPPWTFAIGFARRDPAAPPVQGMTSHPTGCRWGQLGRILRAARRASLRAPSRLRDGPAPRPRRDRLHELGAGDRDLSGRSQGRICKKVKICETGRDGATPSRPCGQRSPPTAYLCEELGIYNPFIARTPVPTADIWHRRRDCTEGIRPTIRR